MLVVYTVLVGYEMIIANSANTRLVGKLSSIISNAQLMEN